MTVVYCHHKNRQEAAVWYDSSLKRFVSPGHEIVYLFDLIAPKHNEQQKQEERVAGPLAAAPGLACCALHIETGCPDLVQLASNIILWLLRKDNIISQHDADDDGCYKHLLNFSQQGKHKYNVSRKQSLSFEPQPIFN